MACPAAAGSRGPRDPTPSLMGLGTSQGDCSTQGGLPRPCSKEGASVSRYLTVMQPRVCEDGLPALGQPKQALSRLQSVKSSGPDYRGRTGWTPIAEPSLEGQPAGRSGPLLQPAWPCSHPSASGKAGGLFQSLLLFPPVKEGHFTHKPCAWCAGGGDSQAFALFLCPRIVWWVPEVLCAWQWMSEIPTGASSPQVLTTWLSLAIHQTELTHM